MLNFLRSLFKLPELRAYEILYRHGNSHYFAREVVAGINVYHAQRAFDTDPRFDKCHRVACTLITRVNLNRAA
jgi:hypothetical protein